MNKHNGMRPQDIVILLKMISLQQENWRIADLAHAMHISASEISESLNRSRIAGLVDPKKRKVFLTSFKEFLIYGLKYVFPVEPGAIVRGVPTAHAASPISEHLSSSSEIFVWPSSNGSHRGQAIQPLYKTIPEIVHEDKIFYELLVIIDTIRIGRAREVKIAIRELEKRI